MTAEADEGPRRAPIEHVPRRWRPVAVVALVAVAAALRFFDVGEGLVAALPRWLVGGLFLAIGLGSIAIGVHEPWARREKERSHRAWHWPTRLMARSSLPAFRVLMAVMGIAVCGIGVMAFAFL